MERLLFAGFVIVIVLFLIREFVRVRRLNQKKGELEEVQVDGAVLTVEEEIAEEKKKQELRREKLEKPE